jgi:pantothenate kinase
MSGVQDGTPGRSAKQRYSDRTKPVSDELARELAARVETTRSRMILGITGAPGSGKSTLSACLARRLGAQRAVVVPMDGYHLSEALIDGTPLKGRKGAPDTFDVGGYVSLLRRLRARDEDVVYAPAYRRGLEEPVAASIAIPADVPLVITEGNYLLLQSTPWDAVRGLLDEAWFVASAEPVRRERLVRRHMSFGMTAAEALAWATGSDEANARLIEGTRDRASRIIDWP